MASLRLIEGDVRCTGMRNEIQKQSRVDGHPSDRKLDGTPTSVI